MIGFKHFLPDKHSWICCFSGDFTAGHPAISVTGIVELDLAAEACAYYEQRFLIETFFSDQKSRGFHLHKSHMRHPARLARLLIAACLAYIWMIYLGVQALSDAMGRRIHRTHRRDLSLFQLGLTLLEEWLTQGNPIDVAFALPPPPLFNSVR